MWKRCLTLAMCVLLSITGCTTVQSVEVADAEQVAVAQMTSYQTLLLLEDTLQNDDLLVMMGQSNLEIDGVQYYVFIVAEASGKALGQVAVCKNDGTMYYYEGERTLSDFSKLTDRIDEVEAEAQAQLEAEQAALEAEQAALLEAEQQAEQELDEVVHQGWDGEYRYEKNEITSQTLKIDHTVGNDLFTYVLDDAAGLAMITQTFDDNVVSTYAVSMDNKTTFTYQEDGSIVVAGTVNGTFVPVVEAAAPVVDATDTTVTDATETDESAATQTDDATETQTDESTDTTTDATTDPTTDAATDPTTEEGTEDVLDQTGTSDEDVDGTDDGASQSGTDDAEAEGTEVADEQTAEESTTEDGEPSDTAPTTDSDTQEETAAGAEISNT